MRLNTLKGLITMLTEAGLTFNRVYGGFRGEKYDNEIRRMIVVAGKNA